MLGEGAGRRVRPRRLGSGECRGAGDRSRVARQGGGGAARRARRRPRPRSGARPRHRARRGPGAVRCRRRGPRSSLVESTSRSARKSAWPSGRGAALVRVTVRVGASVAVAIGVSVDVGVSVGASVDVGVSLGVSVGELVGVVVGDGVGVSSGPPPLPARAKAGRIRSASAMRTTTPSLLRRQDRERFTLLMIVSSRSAPVSGAGPPDGHTRLAQKSHGHEIRHSLLTIGTLRRASAAIDGARRRVVATVGILGASASIVRHSEGP